MGNKISPQSVEALRESAEDNGGSVNPGLPYTLATKYRAEIFPDASMAQDHCGDAIAESLTSHAVDLGQYPLTSFVGYGALQQIAQNGMIRACIQTVADECTREWIDLIGGDETPPDRLTELKAAVEKYDLRGLYNRGIATTGYMGGAFIYIDTGTDDPSVPLRLNSMSAEIQPGGTLRFCLVDPVNATPGKYNAVDPLKSDYLTDPHDWIILNQRVHASRLVILRDNLPPLLMRPAYNFMGIPQAQILWDYVLHWNKSRVAAADILGKLNLLVYQTNTEDLLSSPDGVAQIDAKMLALTRYRNNGSVLLCDRNGDEVKNVALSLGGVTDIVRQSLEFIAAINRTPAVKLLGISPSGFNATGESDIRNYYDHIRATQEKYRGGLMTILHAIQLHLWGEIDPGISFEFASLGGDDMTAASMATSGTVSAVSTLLQSNIISAEEARQRIKEDPAAGFNFLSDEPPAGVEQDITGFTAEDLLNALAPTPSPAEPTAPAPAEPTAPAPAVGEGNAIAEVPTV